MFIPDPWSRIRLFSIPDPGSEFFPSRIPDSHERIYPKYFNPKKWFLSSRKYDPGFSPRPRVRFLSFYPSRIQDPGVKKAPDLDPQHCSGIGLSYRPAGLNRLAGRYDNPKSESTISSSPGLRIWPLFSACRHRWRVPSTMRRVPASASSSIRKTSPGKRCLARLSSQPAENSAA
jgi:hypothetical protein